MQLSQNSFSRLQSQKYDINDHGMDSSIVFDGRLRETGERKHMATNQCCFDKVHYFEIQLERFCSVTLDIVYIQVKEIMQNRCEMWLLIIP